MLTTKHWKTLVAVTVLLVGTAGYSIARADGSNSSGNSSGNSSWSGHEKVACSDSGSEVAHCGTLVEVNGLAQPLVSLAPRGLTPAQVLSAYNLPASPKGGAGKTIAIVNAYDDPTAEADLNTFSAQFGLPACTSKNGCFSKISTNENSRKLPDVDSNWALETSLDIQWAHAIAPGAKILLVEAKSDSFTDLMRGVKLAKSQADYVSISWGAGEFSGERRYDESLGEDGASVFVAAGDSGLIPLYPATSPNVIAVGGTTLNFVDGAFTSETGWVYGGGGCSAFENAKQVQTKILGYTCRGARATPDVSAVADSSLGVSIYDSTPYGASGTAGWYRVGGTSASTPIVTARAALTGKSITASSIYSSTYNFRDIVSGGNAAGCTIGYDLCSGRGSWLG